jgi:hypothetical protein
MNKFFISILAVVCFSLVACKTATTPDAEVEASVSSDVVAEASAPVVDASAPVDVTQEAAVVSDAQVEASAPAADVVVVDVRSDVAADR